jgi:outer membrane scaffolding protein for murein synthesis (MipA/OmpV family)
MRLVLLVLSVILVPLDAQAGKWLDYLRQYDLNDYSVGLAVTGRQSPYIGAENSTYAYPYLTSFRHPSMTADWFVVRDGAIGMRQITSGGWEYSLAGRINTLSFGPDIAEELRGVEQPDWTIELGPSIGLRRWPIHLRLATWFELLGRHSGMMTDLTLSYPIELSRGYIVPAIGFEYQDGDYSDYYYGVSAAAATSARPEYHPGAALGRSARIEWGYQLGSNWLLSGKIGVESLADEIRQSPIVDWEQLWFVNVGLAYNSDLFGPRSMERTDPDAPRFEFRLGVFHDNVYSSLGREEADGVPGFEIDLEDVSGEPDTDNVFQIDASWRIRRFHRIEAGYFELLKSGTTTLPDDLRFGETIFASGSDVTTRTYTRSLRLGYAYSLIRDPQKELGVMAGIHYTSFDATISSSLPNQQEASRVDVPLPVIGVHGSVNIGDNTTVGTKLQIFRTEFDNYEGSLNYFMVDVQRRVGENFNVGIGYNYYAMNLHSSEEEPGGFFKMRHSGPAIFLAASF